MAFQFGGEIVDLGDGLLTELNVPRRIAWRVVKPNHISIWLIHDAPTGVRWNVMFRLSVSQSQTLSVECVPL